MGKSLVREAETLYMSEGLMEILGASETSTDSIDFNTVLSLSLHEEEGRRMLHFTLPKNGMDYPAVTRMFGKTFDISGILPGCVCKIISVACERSSSTISMLGIVLNT